MAGYDLHQDNKSEHLQLKTDRKSRKAELNSTGIEYPYKIPNQTIQVDGKDHPYTGKNY